MTAEKGDMSDTLRLEIAIGYAPITASFPGGRGGLTHMAVIDRDRIVRDVLAAGFRYVPEPDCGYWCDPDVFSGISPLCPVHRGLIPQ